MECATAAIDARSSGHIRDPGRTLSSEITHASPPPDRRPVLLLLVSSDGPSGLAAEPEVVGLAPLRSPEDSLRSIRVPAGFTVELVASEPLVKDPIAFDWGADGRLWVVEMGDYPLGVDGKGKPGGQVRILEDTDGDGRYDKATVFLDGLGFPTGVIPWRNGVIVACAPTSSTPRTATATARPTTARSSSRASSRGTSSTGSTASSSASTAGSTAPTATAAGRSARRRRERRTAIRGRDFRFRPDTGAFEAESGQTQFGRHRDDWGHWFGNNNPNWGWHYVLSECRPQAQPALRPPDPRRTLEPSTRLYPISRTLDRFNDPGAANHVTSANSPTPYRDDLFGPDFARSLFVSEPVHNLVHRMVLEPDGVTFRGVRAPDESDREFLASSDNWFRPTMLKTGPDGALWIADMYRAVIEHPEWIPDDWEAKLDLRAGSEQGRIYRVFPADRKPRPIPRLDRLDTAGLVAALESPNGWQRDTAQRLLLHRGDSSAIAPLRELVAHTKKPRTRVQALWTLADLGGLDESTALAALADPEPRGQAECDQGRRPPREHLARVAEAVLRLADDADARVRLQVAILLGDWHDPRAGRALARLARRDGDDPWMRAAVLSSATPHVATLVTELFREGEAEPSPGLVEPLVKMAGNLPDRAAIESLARSIATPARPGGRFAPWQFSGLAGWLSSRRTSGERTAREGPGSPVRPALGGRPRPGPRRFGRRGRPAPRRVPPGPGRREPSRGSRPARRPAPSPGLRRPPAGGRDRPRADRRRRRPRAPPPGLEGPLPAGPRRDPRRLAGPRVVDLRTARDPRGRPDPAGRHRPRPSPAPPHAPRWRAQGPRRGPLLPSDDVPATGRRRLSPRPGPEGEARRRCPPLQEAVRTPATAWETRASRWARTSPP